MTNTFKQSCKVFGMHLVFLLVSVLFLPTFGWLVGSNTGSKVYSAVTALMLLSTTYSTVWQAGRKDMRYVTSHNKHLEPGEAPATVTPWKGLAIGLIGSIPSFAALAVWIYAWLQGTGSDLYLWVNMGYRIYQSAFLGFLGNDNLTYIWNCVIVTLVVPAMCPIAYFAGTRQFALLEKVLPSVIYKKREPKKHSAR